MEASGQEKRGVGPPLCANSCGFYGNPTTRNLCSKCYRDALLTEQKLTCESSPNYIEETNKLESKGDVIITSGVPTEIIDSNVNCFSKDELCGPESNTSFPNGTTKSESEDLKKVNSSRCFKCNKRIGLLGFQCRCSYYFCGSHRHADSHDCSFDYKAFGREQSQSDNTYAAQDSDVFSIDLRKAIAYDM